MYLKKLPPAKENYSRSSTKAKAPNKTPKNQFFAKSATFSTKFGYHQLFRRISEYIKNSGFSRYERRALLLLVTLVLIGSSIRIYQRRSITNRLEVWNRQSIEQDSLARIKTEYESSLPININLADENLLQQLPGIGPALAGRIIEWRKNNGLFRSVDDLEKVSGIGVVLREKLRGRIVVNTADAMGK